MAINTDRRIGISTVELDVYGGDFSAPTDLGCPDDEDGLQISAPTIQELISKNACSPGIDDYVSWIDSFEITMNFLKHNLTSLAHSVGADPADIVDNSGDSPKNEALDFSTGLNFTKYALRITSLQRDGVLKDIIEFPKVAVKPSFAQTFKNDWRVIPVSFVVMKDTDNGDMFIKFKTEYV